MILKTYVFGEYYPKTDTSARNFTGTAQISDFPREKSRKLSFEHLWFYYRLNNVKRKYSEHINRGVRVIFK